MPVRAENQSEFRKLATCCKNIRTNLPVKRMILVRSDNDPKTLQRLRKLGDITLTESRLGAGAARALGLANVDTEFYGSIDSDVLISPQWYNWCYREIRKPRVAACQGFLQPLSRLYRKLLEVTDIRTGSYFDLGNTMLKTSAIREVGMPTSPVLEDCELRKRLQGSGYLWITNPRLVSRHLVTGLDVLRHSFWFGRSAAEWSKYRFVAPHDWSTFARHAVWLSKNAVQDHKRYGVGLSLFVLTSNLLYAAGSLTASVTK